MPFLRRPWAFARISSPSASFMGGVVMLPGTCIVLSCAVSIRSAGRWTARPAEVNRVSAPARDAASGDLGRVDRLQPLVDERQDLGLAAALAAQVDEALGQRLVALEHEQEPDLEVVDALEDERALVAVGGEVVAELARHLGPVARRLQ